MVWAVTTIVAVAGTAVSAGVAAYGISSQNNNAKAAQQSSNTQLGMEQTQFGEQQQYAQQLNSLIADPSSVTSLPGYQFNMDQGSQAVSRQMAAGGFLNSGNEATALDQYGQGLAMSTFNQQAQLLAGLAGFNAPAYGQNSTAATNASTNANNSSFTQLGGVLASLGYSANRFGGPNTPAPASASPSSPGVDFMNTDFSTGSIFAPGSYTPSYSTGFAAAGLG